MKLSLVNKDLPSVALTSDCDSNLPSHSSESHSCHFGHNGCFIQVPTSFTLPLKNCDDTSILSYFQFSYLSACLDAIEIPPILRLV